MQVDFITRQDLLEFRKEIISEITELLNAKVAPSKQWLKTAEVKKLLGISNNTLQNLRINGTLKPAKMGGILFYKHDDIQKALEKSLKAQ